ncbi:hypothetical protein CEXT_61781 [Caerostris extrusa]|uniref:Uncharacterized protein n=1 Tax=Caerostris extrusa TaxID=172846 RepID=A0AAV4MBN8_CAEEX|nr:hypothetical protein CEXT_61781 [Caerostris extrusa]
MFNNHLSDTEQRLLDHPERYCYRQHSQLSRLAFEPRENFAELVKVRSDGEPLCIICLAKRPLANGDTARNPTMEAPTLSPAMVILSSSPPKYTMFLLTHLNPSSTSHRPEKQTTTRLNAHGQAIVTKGADICSSHSIL